MSLLKNYLLPNIVTLLLIFPIPAFGQAEHEQAMSMLEKKNEVYFSFEKTGKDMQDIARVISIDRIDSCGEVFAYASASGFSRFLDFGLPYEVHDHPGDVGFDLYMKTWEELKTRDLTESWDFYPTYEAYVSLMYDFEDQFPDMVEIVNIGETVLDRDLLFAKISPQVETRRPVPQFMYTSTMHGDETAGFILSLRLIHYLLTNYGEDDAITELMDNVEIWICPNENPDGTYRYDNSTVSGATRGNINGVDLNRNYPNPVNDPWDDEQPETTAMINFTDTMNFIMSANMHGGIELVNFPFDSWTSNQNQHADHDWWEFVMYEYVDTVHAHSPPGYMTGMGDGVTHGGDWYVIYGSRQDYFNYYKSCREFTLELSNQKLLNPDLLPAHWDYNYRSFLNYIRQSTYGIHGTVYNNDTGEPLLAEISLPGHDSDNSEVWTALPHGHYNRPVFQGNYNVTYTATDFDPVTISNVQVFDYETKRVHIGLGDDVSDELVEVSIALENEGGTVLPYTGTEYFNDSAIVYLHAVTDEGWIFDKWEINGELFHDQELAYALDGDADVVAHFSEEETAPLISLDPEEVIFGERVIGSVYTQNLHIHNMGNQVLEITALDLAGDEVFFLDEDMPVLNGLFIQPGEGQQVEVFFQPQEEAHYTAILTIFSNDPDHDEITVPVSGEGVSEAALIKLLPDTMDFGEVNLGEVSEKTLLVTNEGNLPLNISEIHSAHDAFDVSGADLPMALDPGESKVLTASFSPDGDGTFVEEAVFHSNAGNAPEAVLKFFGYGLDPTHVHEHEDSGVHMSVYPNPVDAGSHVLVRLDVTVADASLAISDIYGNLVANLHQGMLPAGEHRFKLSPHYTRMNPGMYFITLSTNRGATSQRIIKM